MSIRNWLFYPWLTGTLVAIAVHGAVFALLIALLPSAKTEATLANAVANPNPVSTAMPLTATIVYTPESLLQTNSTTSTTQTPAATSTSESAEESAERLPRTAQVTESQTGQTTPTATPLATSTVRSSARTPIPTPDTQTSNESTALTTNQTAILKPMKPAIEPAATPPIQTQVEARPSPATTTAPAPITRNQAPPHSTSIHNETTSQVKTENLAQTAGALQQAPQQAIQVATQGINTRPQYRERVLPQYPRRAIQRGWEGRVLIDANIDTSGRVTQAHVFQSSNYNILDRAALSAVKQSTFEPWVDQGQTVNSTVRVPIVFKLH